MSCPIRAGSFALIFSSLCLGCGLFVDTSDYSFGEGGAGPDTSSGTSSGPSTSVGTGGGSGGSTATNSSSEATGSGGGDGCEPVCAPELACMPDGCGGLCEACGAGESCGVTGSCCPNVWAAQFDGEAFRATLASAPGQLYVGNDVGKVVKLETCTGYSQLAAGLDTTLKVRVLKEVAGELVVGGATDTAHLLYRLSPNSLGLIAPPVEMPAEFTVDASNGNFVRLSEVGSDSALWLSALRDGGGFGRYVPGQTPCYVDTYANNGLETRGFANVGTTLVYGVRDPSAEPTSFRVFEPLSASAPCDVSSSSASYPSTTGFLIDMRARGDELFFAESSGPLNADSKGILGRAMPGGPLVELDYDPTPNTDVFTAVAPYNDRVYVAGGFDAVAGTDSYLQGELRIFAYPINFDESSTPIAMATIPNALIPWNIEVDADGVYVVGLSQTQPDVRGFAVKCTLDLQCPAVP
jgi:hypothetical protein